MKPRCVAVIQARMGSTRLPGKVMRALDGRPVLAWVIAAARNSGVCDEIVVATTTDPADDQVADLASCLRTSVVRGPVEDVLTRFVLASEASHADVVIRLTADCPLLDPKIVASCVQAFDADRIDYLTTDHEYTVAHGFDVEVFTAGLLERLDRVTTGADRAHVTLYVATHPDAFLVRDLRLAPASADLRITLDEPADADLLDAIVEELGDGAQVYERVVAFLRARPELVALNAHVLVKPLDAG